MQLLRLLRVVKNGFDLNKKDKKKQKQCRRTRKYARIPAREINLIAHAKRTNAENLTECLKNIKLNVGSGNMHVNNFSYDRWFKLTSRKVH